MSLPPGLVGKGVHDRERRGAGSQREPGDGLGLAVDERERPHEERRELFLLAGCCLELDDQTLADHAFFSFLVFGLSVRRVVPWPVWGLSGGSLGSPLSVLAAIVDEAEQTCPAVVVEHRERHLDRQAAARSRPASKRDRGALTGAQDRTHELLQ